MPDRVLTNADLEKMVDTNDEWITTRTGIKERRIASDDQAASDLAIPAARQALERAGVEAAELDVVIVATSTPDMLFPTTAVIVAEALGAKRAAAYDTLAACSGFLYCTSQAYGLIAGGVATKALVIGSETLSKIVDWTDRGTCILFGDGAGAVVMEPVDERRLPRVRARRGRKPRRRPLPPRRRLAQSGLTGHDRRRGSSGCI